MFRGRTVELPIGQGGMNGAQNLSLVRPDELTEARNINYSSGSITKEGGAAHFSAAALAGGATIIGGWDWWPTVGTHRIVVLTGAGAAAGGALKDDASGAFGTDLCDVIGATNWTSASIPVFVEAGKEAAANNKKLFIFTGADDVHYLDADGVELAPIGANAPADWAALFPTCGANHEGRLWGAGNTNDPHRAYFSRTGDHTDFITTSGPLGSGTISVFPGEGEKIEALVSYKGYLFVFKYPRGIYIIDSSDPTTTATWRCANLTNAIGIAGRRAWCMIEQGILFLDSSGDFNIISATDTSGYFSVTNISDRIYFNQWANTYLSLGRLGNARAIYYPAKKQAHFAISGAGATVQNLTLVWDFNKPTARLRYNNFPATQVELFLKQDTSLIPRPMAGDSAGWVWTLDSSTKSNNGAGYSAEFTTPPMDLSGIDDSAANHRKNGNALEIVHNPMGEWNLQLTPAWDGESMSAIQYSMGGSGAVLGAFVLGASELGGQELITVKHRLPGSGKRISIQGINSGAAQDFSLNKLFLDYQIASRNVQP